MATEFLHCAVIGQDIRLHEDPCVFAPTLTTLFLAEQVDRQTLPGSVALDLGCGSGPIAIALALAGARQVYAVDLMPEACELTLKNAAMNQVADKVTVLQGDLFEPVAERRFDLIVDDVSGVAEDVARLSSWFPVSVPSGGPDGTSHAVRMLRESPRLLNPGGYLLFPVLSLSKSQHILDAASSVYGARLRKAASMRVPFSPELKRQLPALDQLKANGIIDFEQVRSRYFWTLDVYRAQSPLSA